MPSILKPLFFVMASLILVLGGPIRAGQIGARSSAPTNSVTNQANGFAVIVHTDKEMYASDERILFIISLKYDGAGQGDIMNEPRTVYGNTTVLWNGESCLRTAYGKQIVENPTLWGHGASVPTGWKGSFKYHLNRVFDMTRTGEYKISVKWFVLDKQSPTGGLPVDCGPITIHINESDLK